MLNIIVVPCTKVYKDFTLLPNHTKIGRIRIAGLLIHHHFVTPILQYSVF